MGLRNPLLPNPVRRTFWQAVQHFRNGIANGEYRVHEIGDFACKDDNEAIATARELAADRIIEIWIGDRFVARLGAGDLTQFRSVIAVTGAHRVCLIFPDASNLKWMRTGLPS